MADVIESIASIPNTTENFSEVWMSVRRENGLMIERMASRIIARDCQDDVTALIEDQVRLDSSLSYDDAIEIFSIDSMGSSTAVTTAVVHGLSSGDIVVLSCAGDFDGRYEVDSDVDEDIFFFSDFEGTDGSQTIDDESSYNHTVTVNDFGETVEIKTLNPLLGTSSLYVSDSNIFSGDFPYLSFPYHADWSTPALTTGITVEAYIKLEQTNGSILQYILGRSDANNKWQFYVYNGYLSFTTSNGGNQATISSDTQVISVNTEYHVAVVKTGFSVKLYVNQVLIKEDSITITSAQNSSGALDFYFGYCTQGRTDRLKVTLRALESSQFTTGYFALSQRFRILHATLGTPIDSSTYTAFTGTGYARLAADTFTGLDHLEGEIVGILGDGKVLDQETVVGGSVTASTAVGQAHIGLPYYSDLETLDVTFQMEGGTPMGVKLKTGNVMFRFVDSRGGYIGDSEDTLYEAFTDLVTSHNQSELIFTPLDYDWSAQSLTDPASYLFSGDIRRPLGAGWKKGGRVFIRQVDPYPMHVTGVVPEVDSGNPI